MLYYPVLLVRLHCKTQPTISELTTHVIRRRLRLALAVVVRCSVCAKVFRRHNHYDTWCRCNCRLFHSNLEQPFSVSPACYSVLCTCLLLQLLGIYLYRTVQQNEDVMHVFPDITKLFQSSGFLDFFDFLYNRFFLSCLMF